MHIFAPNGGYCLYIPNFQNCARCEKDLKDNKHDSLHLGLKYAGIFVLGHYLFFKAHSLRSRKTVPFSEQTMSADKYPSVFSRHMETIVYVFLQITEKRAFGLILLFVHFNPLFFILNFFFLFVPSIPCYFPLYLFSAN